MHNDNDLNAQRKNVQRGKWVSLKACKPGTRSRVMLEVVAGLEAACGCGGGLPNTFVPWITSFQTSLVRHESCVGSY